MPSANSYWLMLVERWRGWWRRFTRIKRRLAARYGNHDEPSDAPKRRSPAICQLRIIRRRTVIGSVRRQNMYQGLGETYLNVFFWLTAWSFVAAAVTVVIVRVFKRFAIGWGVAAAIMLGTAFACGSNSMLHREMFVQQHQ
ncbi:hypothetical protein NZK35_34130, partial [Stieleria sp. ICT_E10.1]|nr:hypothetical protein [Stieleria sedimenti]